VSSPTSKANENVAMPNLFRWTDSRKSEKDRPESMEEVAAADMEKAKTGTEKPSLWERMFRRSAN
jgi:hypothetical protein